jgi:hypothetical protein
MLQGFHPDRLLRNAKTQQTPGKSFFSEGEGKADLGRAARANKGIRPPRFENTDAGRKAKAAGAGEASALKKPDDAGKKAKAAGAGEASALKKPDDAGKKAKAAGAGEASGPKKPEAESDDEQGSDSSDVDSSERWEDLSSDEDFVLEEKTQRKGIVVGRKGVQRELHVVVGMPKKRKRAHEDEDDGRSDMTMKQKKGHNSSEKSSWNSATPITNPSTMATFSQYNTSRLMCKSLSKSF